MTSSVAAKKRRIWPWVILLIIAAVLYFWPGNWGFSLSMISFSSQTKTTDSDVAADQTKTKQVKESSRILPMFYHEGNLHIGNWQSANNRDLQEIIKKLREVYPKKDIILRYERRGSDPFIDSTRAQEILKQEGFQVIVEEKNNSNN